MRWLCATDALPPFSEDALKKYASDQPNPKSPLRKAVTNARATLWAIYPGQEPKELSGEVSIFRKEIDAQLNVLKEGYRPRGRQRREAVQGWRRKG